MSSPSAQTERTPMINNSSNSSDAQKKKERDDALQNLLLQIKDDPRYSAQAAALDGDLSYAPSHDPYNSVNSVNGAYIANTADQDVAAATNWDLTQCTAWTPTNFLGAPMGVVIWNPAPLKIEEPSTVCCFCSQQQRSIDDPLFKPCPCKTCHRSCFKNWRSGWINPTNYYQCRDCMHSYKIERIAPSNYESPADVRRTIRCKIGQLWAAIILTIAISCSLIATIAWASDKNDKNVPIAIKSLLTSVIYGFPNSNSTKDWREEFKEPSVHVFQYYGLLGAFIVACIILLLSCFTKTTTSERSGNNCCSQCYCDGGGSGTNDGCFWCCVWSNNTTNYGGGGGSSCGNCSCLDCNCGDCGSGGGGGCSGGDCKLGDMGEAAAIIILIVVVVVLVSAIFVAVLFAVRKSSQLHDSVATMIKKQQEELENATVVFGMDEFVRPIDRV